MVDMQVLEDGFAFANFPSTWYPEEFEAQDLVAMFGANESVCVGGVADPCELTAEAAAFARMVNQSRAAGHCEGLAVVAQARFNDTAEPPTSALMDDAETIRAIMRGFATQFIPEVREEVGKWLKTSLEDKVVALANTLAEGKIVYSLGVYDEYGGHAVLPYAVEYRTPEQVRIMVYDSNWPGRNRWVDVDLDEKKWSFSFSGEDPDNDPDIWIGDESRMDLTSIDARNGSCPFCEGSVGVAKNALLVRSSDPNWSVEVGGETVTATSPAAESGDVEVTPFKAQTAPGERPSYDFLIQIPISPEGERAKLNFPGTASVFALTPSGIAQISTPGNPDVPIEVGPTSFVSADPAVTLSLAAGNLVASASGPTASLEIKPEGLTAAVTTADGQVVEVAVTPETPAAKIEADPESGGIQVLAQAASGVVERRDIASDGSVTVTIETTPLNLNATTWEAPAGLESVANPSLPSPDARNLANPDYKPDAPYTPPAEAVPAKEAAATPASAAPASAAPASAAPATAAPATAAPATAAPATAAPATQAPATAAPATQAPATQAPATQAPATQAPATQPPATQAPATQPPATSPPVAAPAPPPPTTTTTAPPILPALSFDPLPSFTYGQGPIFVVVFTNSPAPLSFSVSNPSVASISSTTTNSAQILLVGAGTTSFTVTQSAITGYAAGTFSRTLTVAKATQSAVTVSAATGATGQALFLSAIGGTAGSFTFTLTDSGAGVCTLTGNQLNRSTAGSCTVTTTRSGNDNYHPVTSSARVIEFMSVVYGTAGEGGSFTLTAPAGNRFSSVLFASYGTPDGTAGNFTRGWCHAASSEAIVSTSALFRTSVTLQANNGVFDDPCGGTVKRLYVALAFEPIVVATGCQVLVGAVSGGQDCDKAFLLPGITDVGSKYYSYQSSPFRVWLDLGAFYQPTQFQVWTADDSGGLSHRNPTSFILYSSNDQKTTVSAISAGSISCPAANVSPCSVSNLSVTEAHRYLIVEFATAAGTSTFQISRGIFWGYPGVAPSMSTTAVVTTDPANSDEVDQPLPTRDETFTEDGNESDDALADELLVGALALGARADNSSRQTKRKRRTRLQRTR